jgi:trk system potassium uptake protein TrkH
MILLLLEDCRMNFRMVSKSLGIILICEALLMLPSFLAAFFFEDGDVVAFAITIVLLAFLGLLMFSIKPATRSIYARDGFAIVAFGWILISFFGGLPFYLSGAIPSYVDSFFESSSGFTTTGASILTDIESLPRGILFWRSFTNWIGGMGVLLLTLAILPSVGAGTFHIMRAESAGPAPGKIVPRIGDTAKLLYGIYFCITLVQTILLLAGGMSLYDSFIHAFATAGTGGFSNKNASVGAFDSIFIEIVITVFMFLCGTNFTLYYRVFKGDIKSVLKDEEFRAYAGITIASIILITINIFGTTFKSIWESLRHAIFQVVSIITSTGYITIDFNQWPVFSKCILVLLMFIGACSFSTGGGIKVIRIVILGKVIKRELMRIIHPRSVYSVKIGGRSIDDESLSAVMAFFFFYMLIFACAVLIVSLDGKTFETTVTAVAAMMGNIGLGLGDVGPSGNYNDFSDLSKVILSLCKIIGRLEIYPILLLAMPTFWRKVNI